MAAGQASPGAGPAGWLSEQGMGRVSARAGPALHPCGRKPAVFRRYMSFMDRQCLSSPDDYFFNFGFNHLRSSYIFYETFYLPFNELYTTNQKIKRKMQNDLAGVMEKEGWPTKSRRATRGRVDLGMVEEGGGHSEGGSERPEAGQGS